MSPRRRPEESEHEILDAAERFLREHPLRELTVARLMAHTRLGRSSFYVYFRDREDLVVRLLDRVEGALFAPSLAWLETPDTASLAAALRGVVEVWVEHGPLLRAIVDASAVDAQVELAWRGGTVQRFAHRVAEVIAAEQAAGRVRPGDPEHLAEALLDLNERYLAGTVGAGRGDPRDVAETLEIIWCRTLYG